AAIPNKDDLQKVTESFNLATAVKTVLERADLPVQSFISGGGTTNKIFAADKTDVADALVKLTALKDDLTMADTFKRLSDRLKLFLKSRDYKAAVAAISD